ncbi:13022_t:CDS:2, partial [Acaulospora morrowiae]
MYGRLKGSKTFLVIKAIHLGITLSSPPKAINRAYVSFPVPALAQVHVLTQKLSHLGGLSANLDVKNNHFFLIQLLRKNKTLKPIYCQ